MSETTAEELPASDAPADPVHAKMAALRLRLENARSRITGGKRSNMLDQVADGCVDAIDAILSTLN